MSESLRRSSRRAKKNSFKVGDVVEVNRGGAAPVRGRLVAQLEGSPSSQPRWLVTYDDNSTLDDEELFESSLGSVLSSDNESSPSQPPAPAPSPSPVSSKSAAAAAASRKKNRKNGRFVKASAVETSESKKAVSFEAAAAASDSSVPSSSKRSAREQRTARRNNRLQPDLPPPQPKKRPLVGAAAASVAAAAAKNAAAASKKSKVASDEEVVKVPMLTGTLYLYKGIRRRAEFVRKY